MSTTKQMPNSDSGEVRSNAVPHFTTVPNFTTVKRSKSTWAEVQRNTLLYVLLLPTFLFAITFYYYPLFSGIYHSFTYWGDRKSTRLNSSH